MTIILLLLMLDIGREGEALEMTAHADFAFARQDAGEHLQAARAAAVLAGLWVGAEYDLLSIAHHETRYQPWQITDEGAGYWWAAYDHTARYSRTRLSCGVMTPQPKPSCEPWELTLAGGYLHGAQHLREWAWRCGLAHAADVRICALNRYAGGQVNDPQAPGQPTWVTFATRAYRIKKAVEGL